MKEWLTAGEIAKMKLPGMSEHPVAVRRFMEKEGVKDDPRLCRHREGSGGGYWYHYTAMAPEAIVAYDARENGLEVSGQSKVIFSVKRQRERAFINAMHYRYPDLDGGGLWRLYEKAFGKQGSGVEIPREAEFTKYCNVLFSGETSFEQKLYALIANEISQYNNIYLSHLVVERTKAQYELLAEFGRIDLMDKESALNALDALRAIAARQWNDVPENIKRVFEGEPVELSEGDGPSEDLYRLTITKLTNELNAERERMRALREVIKKHTSGWKTDNPNALQGRLRAIADAAYSTGW